MSKKRRENHEQRQPMTLTARHYLIGVAVVAVSAALAIGLFTYFVGTSFGEKKPSPDDIPQAGALLPGERSAAADVLANKSWGDMTQADRDLVKSEVNRVFDDAQFRARSPLVAGIDVFRAGGRTRVSRQYLLLKDPAPNMAYAETLDFYCPQADGLIHHIKYFKTPTGTEFGEEAQDPRSQPFGIIVSVLVWDDSVVDLGFDDVSGRRVHGLRFSSSSVTPEGETTVQMKDYWWDVENARLMVREEYKEGADLSSSRYALEWRSLPPLQIADDQQRPDCVPELMAQFAG